MIKLKLKKSGNNIIGSAKLTGNFDDLVQEYAAIEHYFATTYPEIAIKANMIKKEVKYDQNNF